MPNYTSRDFVKSGVPLGGIGAGKLEILPQGSLDFFTCQNNPHSPLNNHGHGILGFHFGIFVGNTDEHRFPPQKLAGPPKHYGGKKQINTDKKLFNSLLQTERVGRYPLIERIEYEGLFPFAKLKYLDKKLPLQLSLEAFSCFIPRDHKNSSLPAANFLFKIKNPTRKTLTISLLVIGKNIVGSWGVGRFNQIIKKEKSLSLLFSHQNPRPDDNTAGDLNITVPQERNSEISYLGEFNLHKKQFILNQDNINLKGFEIFSQSGTLPNINTKKPVTSESVQLAGALAIKRKISPGQEIQIPVIFSWYFPAKNLSHHYQKRYKNSLAVARYLLKSKNTLYKKTKSFQESILKLNLAPWLKDALLNNLYPLISSSVYTKEDKFSLFEAPEICPLMGTLDVRFYASIATLLLFPELELNELRQFAKAQRSDGYIPHDLGNRRLDSPSDGTTNIRWKDLNSKFILMVYRDYLFTQDKKFLRELYPKAKKALKWILATDKNKDFLPDDAGQDQTFDLWPFYGVSSYVGSIFLASLLAMQKMAQILDDRQTEEFCRIYFPWARESFSDKLWQKNYFICYRSENKKSLACTVGQLTGQWYAHLLDLGYIIEPKKVRAAIQKIFSFNAQDSQFGATNSLFLNKKKDSVCRQSENIFLGITYAFSSLAIYEGFSKEALKLARKTWENLVKLQKNPWNQPDMVSSKTGKYLFGDHYMRNLGIFSLLLALKKAQKIKAL